MIKISYYAIALFLLAGCATQATGHKFSRNITANTDGEDNYATIYFYRDYYFLGSSLDFIIKLEREPICRLKNNGYCVLKTLAGQKNLHSRLGIFWSEKLLDVEAGKTYYVKAGIDEYFIFIYYVMVPYLVVINEKKALGDISDNLMETDIVEL